MRKHFCVIKKISQINHCWADTRYDFDIKIFLFVDYVNYIFIFFFPIFLCYFFLCFLVKIIFVLPIRCSTGNEWMKMLFTCGNHRQSFHSHHSFLALVHFILHAITTFQSFSNFFAIVFVFFPRHENSALDFEVLRSILLRNVFYNLSRKV